MADINPDVVKEQIRVQGELVRKLKSVSSDPVQVYLIWIISSYLVIIFICY